MKKKKSIFLIFAVGAVLVLILSWRMTSSFKDDHQASLKDVLGQDKSQGEGKTVYSFYKDDDLDGLSNAKEIIFGSSPTNPDTDGDGYSDGEEVANGYDPIRAGSFRLEERENLSLSISYFLWAQEKGIKDPLIEAVLVDEYLAQRQDLTSIPLIRDEDINLSSDNSQEALRIYLADLNKIGLPEGIISYQEIAASYDKSSESLLEELLSKIELAYLDFVSLKTPLAAKEIQRGYLSIVKEFLKMFSDLRDYQKDPLRIELNLRKAPRLIDLAEDIEKQKLELRNNYNLG